MNRHFKMKLWLRMLLAAVVAAIAPRAIAGPDSFGLGDGHNGVQTIGSLNTVINAYAQVTAPLAPGDTSISVTSAAGFASGDLVMVLQTTGIVPAPGSGAPGPVNLSNDAVGRWELARLSGAGGGTLTLSGPLLHPYAGSVTQVIKVPEYDSLTVSSGASIIATPWDGNVGGVVAFLVQNTLTVNGSIRAIGAGFRGGVYFNDGTNSTGCSGLDEPAAAGAEKGEGIANLRYGITETGRGNVANGAGGGVCLQSGGGGGGNGGAGGQGGNTSLADGSRTVGGIGGAALTYSGLDHLTLGGGGGAGQGNDGTGGAGGQGGGIIFIRAGQLAGSSGTGIAASGNAGANSDTDGASGGGSGGTIYLRIAGTAACGVPVAARGGLGGNVNLGTAGPGGGGGGGQVLYQACSLACAPSVSGATSGVENGGGTAYGATGGSPGASTVLTNCFAVPATPTVVTPGNASSTNNPRPILSGMATANIQVVIYLDGAELNRVTADGAGNWTFTPLADLPAGSHQVTAAAAAEAVQSVPSAANTFVIDLTAPAAPVVNTPGNASATNNNRPPVSGTAEANSTVTVYIDGSFAGTTTADGGGAWTFTPGTSLSDTSHTVRATATDAAGNVSGFSNTNTFTVDTTPPATPTVAAPANGAVTGVSRPAISGTAEANSTVTVYIDNASAGTTTASAAGSWTFTPATALSDAQHDVKVTATDAVGNVSVFSATNTFTVDTLPPGAPTVTAPANGAAINNNRPTVTGTAEANSTLTLYIDGNIVSSTIPVDGGGNWSFTLTSTLSDASHTARATAMDAAGNVSVFSATNTFTVDTAVPGAPTVTAPANRLVTNDNTPLVTGTAEANSTVTVYIDNNPVGTANANGSGAWTFTVTPALSDANHTVSATATDAAGNVSPLSNINTFTVDTVVPNAPVVTAPADGSSVNTRTPTFVGTAEGDSIITLYVDGSVYDTVQADSAGNWSILALAPLSEASHQVRATATDAAGNVSPFSATNTFTVDATPPSAPVIDTPANNASVGTGLPTFSGTAEPGVTVTLYLDNASAGSATANGAGAWTFTLTGTPLPDGFHSVAAEATDAAGNVSSRSSTNNFFVDTTAPAAPIFTFPTNGQSINTNTPTLTGTAEPNAAVVIELDFGTGAQVTLNTTADVNGVWSVPVTGPLAEGAHTARAKATDSVGNPGPFSTPITFTVDTSVPVAPVVTAPANGALLRTNQPTITGTAEPGVQILIFFNGTQANGSATADGAGNWSYLPSAFNVTLSQGTNTVFARARDAAGNVSPNSNTNTFTVDTVAPAAPTVVTPADNSTVTTTTPAISGTAEAGSTVTIYVDGNVYGSPTADGSGQWTFTGAALTEGAHTVSATATDAAGNVSPMSAVNNFIVSTTPPDTTITAGPADNGTTNSSTATFTFTSTKPSSTFECNVDNAGFTPCTTPFTVTGLSEGAHTIAVRAIETATGLVDPTPATRSWTVDTTPPGAPTVTAPPQGAVLGDNTPTITGTGEAGGTVTISIDGTAVGTATVDSGGNWTFTPGTALGDGPHTVTASASDPAGNTAASPGRGFVVDTTPPDTTLTATPDAQSRVKDATFEFSSTEQGVTFECSLDGGAFAACTSPAQYADLAQGSHTFAVRAKDAAGNVDATPASFGWTVLTGGHFTGGGVGSGIGCSATGGESALALLSVLGLLAQAARRRRR